MASRLGRDDGAIRRDRRWNVNLCIGSREALRDFQSHCRDHKTNFDQIRLYELTEPKMGQINIAEKQQEVFITAMGMGYLKSSRSHARSGGRCAEHLEAGCL